MPNITGNKQTADNRHMKMTGTRLRQQRLSLGLSQARLAEITKVPQHMLSAFELGKTELPAGLCAAVVKALANKEGVAAVANRTKRYRDHKYTKIQTLPERAALASQTDENAVYRHTLHEIHQRHGRSGNKPFSALSLFSGCGGFSLGFSAAGFQVKGFLELDDDLRKIYQLNFPDSVEMGNDITRVTPKSLTQLHEALGGVDLIIGGPPCQGFSLSGKRDASDPRNELFKHYLRFVDAFRPKITVLENVRLLTSMKNRKGGLVQDDICNEFEKHGYRIKCFEVNAKHYGVPQHRERVLFVAARYDLDIPLSLPDPTHGDGFNLFSQLKPVRTFADACSDLPYLESGGKSDIHLHEAVNHPKHVIDWLWDVPQGKSAHDNKNPDKRPPSGYNTTYKRQIWHEPAATVQTTSGMISGCRNVHPIATRSMTIREAARLQSFPDEYLFVGT